MLERLWVVLVVVGYLGAGGLLFQLIEPPPSPPKQPIAKHTEACLNQLWIITVTSCPGREPRKADGGPNTIHAMACNPANLWIATVLITIIPIYPRLIFFTFFASSSGLMFIVKTSSIRCLKSQGAKEEIVIGFYEISEIPNHTVDILVTDWRRHVLAQIPKAKSGRFTFITEDDLYFEICFKSNAPSYTNLNHYVNLTIKTGIEAKSAKSMEEVAKLKPAEGGLVMAEELSKAVIMEYVNLKKREESLRNTNESTIDRVFYMGVFNVIWLFSSTALQVLYLHRYFKGKKLIE